MRRAFGLLCAVASLALAGASRAEDVAFSLHGERFSDGYIDGTFFGLAPSGESAPTGVSFTVHPYYGNFTPFTEALSSSDFKPGSEFFIKDGQVEGVVLDTIDSLNPEKLSINYSNNSSNYFYNFDAVNQGWDIYASITDSFNGGYPTFSVSSAPEPAIWTMMIVGVGLLGGLLRRRGRGVAIAA